MTDTSLSSTGRTAIPAGLATPSVPPGRAGPRTRERVSVARIAEELWAARDLVEQFVRRDITIRYTQAVMGFAWAILTPLLVVFAGLIMRYIMARASNEPLSSQSFAALAVKAIPWSFFSGAISMATVSVLAQAGLIGKVYFARETLPFASVLTQAFDSLIGAVAVAVLLVAIGIKVTLAIVWVPVLALLLLAFTLGLSLILSCANLFFRDVKYLVQVVLTFGVFVTPVFFEPYALGARGARFFYLQPLTPLFEGFRLSIVEGHNLLTTRWHALPNGETIIEWSPWMLAYAVVWSFGLLWLGARIFRRGSTRFAEVA